jgi:hypothetical protein
MSVRTAGLPVALRDRWRRVRTGRGALAKRAGWGIADQALSSLTNFVLVVVVAHQSTAAGFGLFALVFATYSVALGCCRAVCSEPLSVRFSHVSPSAWRDGAALATGGAIMVGMLAGAVCVIAGIAVGGQARALFVILGISLPGLLLQDTWRYSFFADRHGSKAFANDAVDATLLLPAVVCLLLIGHPDAEGLLALWGGAASVAALVGIRQAGVLPRPLRVASWWRRQADLAPRYLAEYLAVTGDSQLVLYGVAALASLGAVAALRGGLLLLGPLNILVFGAMLSAVPEAVRLLRTSPQRLMLASAAIAAGLAALTLLWAGLLLALPSSFGRSVIGPVWNDARPVILPLAIGTAALGLVVGAVIGLRALAAVRRSLRARLTVSPIIFAAALLGAAAGGGVGAAWGLAVGQTLAATVFWYHLIRAVSEHGEERRSVAAATIPLAMTEATTQIPSQLSTQPS